MGKPQLRLLHPLKTTQYNPKTSPITTVICQFVFNETKRTATKFEGLEKREYSNSLSKVYCLSSSAL